MHLRMCHEIYLYWDINTECRISYKIHAFLKKILVRKKREEDVQPSLVKSKIDKNLMLGTSHKVVLSFQYTFIQWGHLYQLNKVVVQNKETYMVFSKSPGLKKYTQPLNNTGLNCSGSLIHRFLFTDAVQFCKCISSPLWFS